MTRALLLDLDDTVADSHGAFLSWLQTLLARLPEPQRAPAAAFLTGDEAHALRPAACFAELERRVGTTLTGAEITAAFTRELPAFSMLVPGAAQALAALRDAGWRLAVVTNGPSLLQRGKVEHLGLEALVDAVIVSEEVGAAKPDQEIFTAALRALRARPDQAWMVGDNPVADMGAARAGVRTIWLSLGRDWPGGPVQPDVVLPDFPAAARHLLASGPPLH